GLAFGRLPVVEDSCDVRMTQGRDGAHFAQKTGAVFFGRRRKKLDGHAPAERRIVGQIDDAHAAFTELLNDPITRNCLTDHGLEFRPSETGRIAKKIVRVWEASGRLPSAEFSDRILL